MNDTMSVLRLTVFSENLKHNFLLMRRTYPDAQIAAVVKANGYGLGIENVVPPLAEAGCKTFFVNRFEEGEKIRRLTDSAAVFVLDAFIGEDTLQSYKNARLTPVFSTVEALSRYPQEQNIAVRLDTGFNLAGIDAFDEQTVLQALKGRSVSLLISHLSCAERPEDPKNGKQLALFSKYAALFPEAEKSFAASFGAALGKEYRFDMIRAGAALYGSSALPDSLSVASLTSKVGWLRRFKAGESIGYNDACLLKKDTLVASVPVGSGDGIVHKAGCFVRFKDTLLPVLSAPTTNYLPVDANAVSDDIHVGDEVALFDDVYTPDRLALDAGMEVGADVLIRLNGASFS
ncbi:MAG: alanine racemase [Alphaproteobacteria bacterium]|nr:alanine racemase [Alphaproteobacteria bacterium]